MKNLTWLFIYKHKSVCIKNKGRLLGLFFFGLTLLTLPGFTADIQPLPNFTSNDRILILAPHPDDETIGTAGIILKALTAGAKINVVCLTNGDNNELSFIIYEKRLTFRKKEFIHMGQVRRNETITAMNSLGLNSDDIIFLGYPDLGTLEILTKYWGNVKPYKSIFPRVRKVPYLDAVSPNAPYVGESILNDLKTILNHFNPSKIFVSHPADTNCDHRALYLFLQIALWDIQNKINKPEIYPYIIHAYGWPKPRGFHPNIELTIPKKLTQYDIIWNNINLDEKETTLKYKAILHYKSQIKYSKKYLTTFARKSELFGDFPIITLKKQSNNEFFWQYFSDPKNQSQNTNEDIKINPISAIAYAHDGNDLLIQLKLHKNFSKEFGINVYLLGYSHTKNFSTMPKLKLSLSIFGLHIKDKRQSLFIKNAILTNKKNTLILKIPLLSLGHPNYILASAKASRGGIPFEETAWRILQIANE